MLQKQAWVSLIDYFYCVCFVQSRKNLLDNTKNNNIGAVDWLGRVNLRTTVAIVTHLMMS
jgi:hypothetical protein